MKDSIKRLLQEGLSKKEISKILGVSYSTIRKYSVGSASQPKRKNHICSDCGETDSTRFYGKMRSRCKSCHNRKGYDDQQKKISEYAASRGPIACSRCGYDRSFAALE